MISKLWLVVLLHVSCNKCRHVKVGFQDLADETTYTPYTYPGHFLNTCDILHWYSDTFLIDIWSFQHPLVYLWLFNVWATSHVDHTAIVTYYQLYHSMFHLYSILSTFNLLYHWKLRYCHLYHMAINYYCDVLLKQWLLHSSHDIPTHFTIFIIWFHIFSSFDIYLTLPYPHKKNKREIRSPHRLGLLRLHCDCVSTVTVSYTLYCSF
jgi:hypothetical protein